MPAGEKLVPEHHPDEDDEADEEIDKRHDYCGRGHDKAGEINLADEVGVADEAVGRFRQRGGKKLPRQQARKNHQRIRGRAFGRQFGDFAENEGEHHHRQKRPDQCPYQADDGLLVSDRHVAPGQHVKKLPVAPQVAPIVALGAAGFDDEDFFRLHAVPLVIILSWPGAGQ